MTAVARSEVVQSFLDLYEAPAYLEIGVSQGTTFHAVRAARKVAVDPRYKFDIEEAARSRPEARYHTLTSDAYFGGPGAAETFDVIYVDGLHTFEQTLRDFLNALERLQPKGVIVIDDVYPVSYASSLRDVRTSKRLRAGLGIEKAAWMGDVYRLVYFIESFCQGLSYAGVAENHGQLVVWRAPRPAGAVRERLVEEVGRLPYEAVVLEPEAFAFTPLAEIVACVRACMEGRPPPARSASPATPGGERARPPRVDGLNREERRAMRKELKKGDKVAWNTSQGETTGEVVRKQTSPTKIKGHEVKASAENPEYIVRSDKSGAEAAHKPEALR